MSKRSYTHVQALLPEIRQRWNRGKHSGDRGVLGFKDKAVVKRLLARERRKQIQGVPKQRGRKPAKTLAEYKNENKRLRMENELLRDFLQSTERK